MLVKKGTVSFLIGLAIVAIMAACTSTTSEPPAAPAAAPPPAAVPAAAQPTEASQPTSATDTWQPQDVIKATGVEQCQPLAALPKTFQKPWKLAFVHANKGNPYHGTAAQGMEAAAKFYGVDFIEADAAGGAGNVMLDLANTLLVQNPDAIGVLGQGPDVYEPVAAAAQDKGAVFLSVDSGKSEYSPYVYGIPDAESGKTGGELLAKGVQEQMDSDWAGRELFFVEFTHSAIPACVNRTGGAAKGFADAMQLDADHVLMADAAGGQSTQDMMAAILTAHPDAVFGMIPCWDQLGIDPFNSAKEAGRGDDVMLVTLGGDKPPADLLVTKPKGYYGYVEWQPFCEGWGWTETVLAILEGIPSEPYQTRFITTQDNIDQRYQDLYGALPTPVPQQ